MDIRDLPVDDIVLDGDLNLRDRLDDFTVERYADAWERMPPVTVFEVDGRFLMADGFHRHAAAVMIGRRTIPAEIRQGTREEALDFVTGVNLFHGLPLTRAERRRAVEVKLRLHPDWSDRRIAEGMGVGRELIAKIRRQLVEAGQVPGDLGRVGSDGKTYTAGVPRGESPRNAPFEEQEGPRERNRERDNRPPWDDTVDPLPPVADPAHAQGRAAVAEVGDKKVAQGPPISPAAPSIDEMLSMMARQVMEVVGWSQAEGFNEAYRDASGNARGLFQSAVIKLAARADQLRKA